MRSSHSFLDTENNNNKSQNQSWVDPMDDEAGPGSQNIDKDSSFAIKNPVKTNSVSYTFGNYVNYSRM